MQLVSLDKGSLVSVLMTAYNREKYIGQAIESVLSSTYRNFELIIVDDCSNDKTVEIAREYEAKDQHKIKVYVNETNLGDYPNRNRAASYASGKYLKYLDSDDMIYPTGLEAFVWCMEKHPEAALGLCSSVIQESRPFPIFFSSEESYRYHFFKQGFLDCGPSGVIIRRDIFNQLGGFSGKRMIGDKELWLKIAAQYPVSILPPGLIFWRIHEEQEFASGVQSGLYLETLLPLIENALYSPACRLSPAEKKEIINHYRKIATREIIKLAVQQKKFKKSWTLAKKTGIKFKDLVNALFFMNRSPKLQLEK